MNEEEGEMMNQDSKVKAHCIQEGWYFEADGKRLGPYSFEETQEEAFIGNLVEELGVSGVEIAAAKLKDFQREMNIDELDSILSSTIKRDLPDKLITFLAMLLAQTEADSFNITFEGESCTGKTYIPLEVIEYFPQEEQMVLGGASPTSLIHDAGQWDKKRKVIVLDFGGKIIIFLDQPHWMLMEKLRPFLSHDRKVLVYKITDRSEKYGLKTKNVELRGFPVVIFCTTKPALDDQESTRVWYLSPSADQRKLKESLEVLDDKISDRTRYRQMIENDPRRIWLRTRVTYIRASGVRSVIIPKGLRVLERFLAGRQSIAPRNQRDYPRLLTLIKGFALLNYFSRERISDSTIVANESDVEQAFQIYTAVAIPNELGISPETYDIYNMVIRPLMEKGMETTTEEISMQYRKVYGRPMSYTRLIKYILPSLESVGLISRRADPEDRRKSLISSRLMVPEHADSSKDLDLRNVTLLISKDSRQE